MERLGLNDRGDGRAVDLDITGVDGCVSVDAIGNAEMAVDSIRGLREQGRHVLGGQRRCECWAVAAKELEVPGPRGMPVGDS